METTKESTDTKLYYDAGKFKGNTFENNINIINKLYLGLGLKISEVPYIYIDESDNKTYLSANCFTIKTIKEGNKTGLMEKTQEEEKTIYYPISFLYNVFYENNTIFYLDSNSQLNVYKLDKESLSMKKSLIQRELPEEIQKNKPVDKKTDKSKDITKNKPKKKKEENTQNNNNIKKEPNDKVNDTNEILSENKNPIYNNNQIEIPKNKINKEDENSSGKISSMNDKPTSLTNENNKVETIMKKLEKINYNNDIKQYYEILCDILEKDLHIVLNLSYPKPLKGTLLFKINESDELKHICSIKNIKYEIDGIGLIREKLKLQNGKVTFKDGIKAINVAITMKNEISFNNTFKSPILFKNFDDEVIPANKVLLFEIKSGFDIEGLHRQFKERIDSINNFIFNKDEKPLYYIGIVNFNSNNIDKLDKYSNYNFNDVNDKIIIVATIDYNFFNIDLSYEINEGYLLIKKIENLENQISDLKNEISDLKNEINNKFDSFGRKTDENFQNLLTEIKSLHPEHKFIKISASEKNKNINIEEKKNDS